PGQAQVVSIALQYLGVPYVWGGSTPSGFDCSGLTQYCYRQVGVSLPRTSQSQYQAGQHIARDRLDLLRPGDLVFFGTNGDAGDVHHVGMYVGDGNYVHAPYTGAVVRVDSLNARISSRSDYVGGSRF
ncbi:MAG: C40 family peptidase, partial [Coriobacteriia bacterium]